MNYKEIVAEAWHFTQENKRLAIWYGAVPALFTTAFSIGYVIYQYYSFLASKLFQDWGKSFASVVFTRALDFLSHNHNLIVPLILAVLFFGLCYTVLPVVCEGGLIQLIARRKNGQQVRGRSGVNFGFMTFLPLLEYKLFIQTFSLVSIFSILATSVRTFGFNVLNILVPIFIFVLLVALILALFFTYTEFYIVIDNNGVFTSLAKSIKLVTEHLEETVLLTILMLIIGVRIIIQILFVFLIPAIALGAVYLLAAANLPNLGLLMGGILGLLGLMLASYLNGIIHVFAMTVWTFTFLKLTTLEKINARGEVIKEQEST